MPPSLRYVPPDPTRSGIRLEFANKRNDGLGSRSAGAPPAGDGPNQVGESGTMLPDWRSQYVSLSPSPANGGALQ